MLGALESLRALAGDALTAAKVALRTSCTGFYDYHEAFPDAAGRMESDGPDQAAPTPTIPRGDVRSALAEQSDSSLIAIAADVIHGWTPLLLKTSRDVSGADLLVEALRDRAAQFAAVEDKAAELAAARLGAHLTRSAHPRPE